MWSDGQGLGRGPRVRLTLRAQQPGARAGACREHRPTGVSGAGRPGRHTHKSASFYSIYLACLEYAVLRPRNVFPDVLPLPLAKRKCQKHMLGAEALGSENTCCERLRGVRVSQGELVAGRRCESYSCGRKRPERGSGSWRACHLQGLQLLQGLGNPKAGGWGGAKGRGRGEGPDPEGTAAGDSRAAGR